MKKAIIIILIIAVIAASCFAVYSALDVGERVDDSLFSQVSTAPTHTVYVWNKDKEPTKEGVRFALVEKTGLNIPLWKIFLRGTSDIGKIKKQIADLGNTSVDFCVLYSYDGYDVSGYPQFTEMQKYLFDSSGTDTFRYAGQYDKLRDNSSLEGRMISGVGRSWDKTISGQLEEFGEVSIRESDKEVYRFSYFAGGANTSYRVTVTDDGGEMIYNYKSLYGKNEGKIYQSTITLTKEQTENIVHEFKKANFWELESNDATTLLDGSCDVFEAVKDGKYHIVRRNNSVNGSWYDDMFRLFINLQQGEQNEIR